MEELGLIGDLALVAVAALAGGALAHALRLPSILGYLAAGVLLGPNTPGPVTDVEEVRAIADLGVALLMFTLGIRFSLRELYAVRRLAVFGGGLQMALTGLAGAGLGAALGLDLEEAVAAGMVVTISSTMVALRLLEQRGEIGTAAGRVAVAVALFQDIAVVPLVIMIPVIAGAGEGFAVELGLAALKGVALVAGVWLAGTFAVPRVLYFASRSRSREIFLLAIVALALGTASISFLAGLSLAFGAFLAGLLISESEYAHRTLAEVFPLREVFAVVFFVAMGMLIDPDVFAERPDLVFGFAAVGVLLKVLVITPAALAFDYPARAALLAGLALGNMGEFSFVLATTAEEEGVFDVALSHALLGAVLVSIAVSPLLFRAQGPITAALGRLPAGARLTGRALEVHIPDPAQLVNHAVICGFDDAGREAANALAARNFRYLVVEEDPTWIRWLSARGIPCILGDPALPAVLEQTGLDKARVLLVTVRDPLQAEACVALARDMNPRLDIIARASDWESYARLMRIGASRVVQPEFEAGLEFARHTLQRFGLTSGEIAAVLSGRRREYTSALPPAPEAG